jgi:type II secretory pathway pseudopilin PulG
MTVVAVTAILAAVAVPSMKETLQRNAQQSVLADLSNTLSFARSQAITRSQLISICQSSDGASCSTTSLGDWSAGWIVFVDPTPPTSATAPISAVVDANEQVLRVHGPVRGGTSVKVREGLVAGDVRTSLRFDRNGLLNAVGPTQALFTVCRQTNDASTALGLFVNLVGRLSFTRDSDGNGKQDFPVGGAVEDLSC